MFPKNYFARQYFSKYLVWNYIIVVVSKIPDYVRNVIISVETKIIILLKDINIYENY